MHVFFFQPIYGHRDYINAVCFEPNNGQKFATASDDMTCRVWDLTGVPLLELQLKSAGVSVEWPKNDPNMVRVDAFTVKKPLFEI